MITWIKKILVTMITKKYLLGGAIEVYRFIEGKKTLLSTIGAGTIYGLKIMGYIPPELADTLISALFGAGGIAFAQKLKRIDDKYTISKTAKGLREKALIALAKENEQKENSK